MAPGEIDDLLARYLGGDLQQATLRLVGGAVVAAAVAAVIVAIL